ncbi:hypothetical protein [Streptomyces specialis]|uniref:hypothetical protein n=1 Tax=Streptomyces specialis TaxID=498367 RepID=UPI00073E4CB6|nr:hypothetical protein [Streptomyces specialis]
MTSNEPRRPHVESYTRNGLAGPAATVHRDQYTPPYTRVRGSYAPYRINLNHLADDVWHERRGLPVPVLTGEGVSVESDWRVEPMPFALRNVTADELHYVLRGSARLETDFGVLDLRAGDFVLIPRAVTYRLTAITQALQEIVVVTDEAPAFRTEDRPRVLDTRRHVDIPAPQGPPAAIDGEFELVVRHGRELTSYFYDYDPMACLKTDGEPVVRRFNLRDVHRAGTGQDARPVCLLADDRDLTRLHSVGGRGGERPPIHRNADYDEVVLYAGGPGSFGAVDQTGTMMWTPKGLTQQGPAGEPGASFRAWMLETRSPLALTPAGREVARLMETGGFDLHKRPRRDPLL